MLRKLIVFFCLGGLLACTNIGVERLSGEIDQSFISSLASLNHRKRIVINSTGGDPDFGEKAAMLIEEKQLRVVIDGLCFSSCAEYILPSAADLVFTQNAVIGFHQNPTMIDFFRNEYSTQDRPLCFYEDNLSFISNLHKRKLGHDKFWRTVLDQLNLVDVEIVEKDSCSETGFRFAHDLWIPSSVTLRSEYGLKFKGSVCVDSKKCRKKLSDVLVSKGVNYIIDE